MTMRRLPASKHAHSSACMQFLGIQAGLLMMSAPTQEQVILNGLIDATAGEQCIKYGLCTYEIVVDHWNKRHEVYHDAHALASRPLLHAKAAGLWS